MLWQSYIAQLMTMKSHSLPDFYVHGTVHRNSLSINVQQDATIHSLFYL